MLLRILPLAAVALLAGPGDAAAGTARVTGSTLEYVSDVGEPDALQIYRTGPDFYVNPARPGPECDAAPGGARCPANGVTAIRVELGDADDLARIGHTPNIGVPVSVSGGDGADEVDLGLYAAEPTNRLTGGEGNDALFSEAGTVDGEGGDDFLNGDGAALLGGAGNDVLKRNGDRAGFFSGGDGDDFLATQHGGADTGECGPGRDSYVADASDELSADCEDRLVDLVTAMVGELARKLKRLGIAGLLRKKRIAVDFRPPREGNLVLGEPAGARSRSELVLIDDVPELTPHRSTRVALALTRRGRRVLQGARTYKAKLLARYEVEWMHHPVAEAEVVRRVTLRR